MPVHIEEMTTEVTVFDGELPLSPQQIEKLIKIVLQRLAEQKLREQRNRADSQVRSSVMPRDWSDEG